MKRSVARHACGLPRWFTPRRAGLAWLLLPLVALSPGVAGAQPQSRVTGKVLPSEYVLIVTGGELLDGSIRDAHTPFITRTLRPLGLRCVRTVFVDDTPAELEAALRDATQRSRLVLTTGGLGPTANDVTRQVLTSFTGVPLREDPAIVSELAQRFGQLPAQLRDNLRRQALVPVSGAYFPNDRGTAVGLLFETDEATIIAPPGPPRELQPMVSERLVPWFRDHLGLPKNGVSITLRFVGIGQSAIDASIREHIALPADMVTSSRFDGSRVDFTFSLPEDTARARAALSALSTGLTQHLGRYLYATNDDSLEQVAWARLAAEGSSLVIVEAQGPHLAAAFARAELPASAELTSIAASSENELRRILGLDGASVDQVSDPVRRVRALGAAARRLTGARWALVVGEVLDSAGTGATLCVALGHPDGEWDTWRLAARESPETGRPGLVNTVLDRLRRVE